MPLGLCGRVCLGSSDGHAFCPSSTNEATGRLSFIGLIAGAQFMKLA